MYIEYKEGEKHGSLNADRSESIETFKDCGKLLDGEDVVVDIDHLPKESIRAMIETFGIKTMTVWTDRGVHLWFKKPRWFRRRSDGVCRLGFEIEQHTKSQNPFGMTVKRNGIARPIDNEGVQQYMPDIFAVDKKHFKDLTGMSEGEGRNKALFEHRKALKDCKNWEKILKFINQHVFGDPLPDDELADIMREMPNDSTGEKGEQYLIATNLIEQLHTVVYSGMIWWFKDGEYDADPKNSELIRRVYEKCEGQMSRYVDEVIRQIMYRSPLIPGDEVFPIRMRNGIILRGTFIPYRDYREFTPYYIDIDYKENAQPVQIVDDYINELTSSDPDYKLLLMEVIGYVMITDPERIRSLGKFFMFRGDGSNGKGTLLQIMKKIYNAKNCTNLSIRQLTDDRFKVTMIGKLANLGDDIETDAIDNNQLKVLKNISTADTVSTRHLYSESESTTFTTKLYFTTNSDIRSFEKGYAYKRRIVWLPMFNKIEKPDPTFITKITSKEALEYWISLIVEGYKRLYQNQKWTDCKIVQDYNDQYHEENNVSLQFAKELDPDTEIIGKTMSDIQNAFSVWSTDERKFSPKLFKNAVWDLYEIGIGRSKIDGATRRTFMKQSDTQQKLQH